MVRDADGPQSVGELYEGDLTRWDKQFFALNSFWLFLVPKGHFRATRHICRPAGPRRAPHRPGLDPNHPKVRCPCLTLSSACGLSWPRRQTSSHHSDHHRHRRRALWSRMWTWRKHQLLLPTRGGHPNVMHDFRDSTEACSHLCCMLRSLCALCLRCHQGRRLQGQGDWPQHCRAHRAWLQNRRTGCDWRQHRRAHRAWLHHRRAHRAWPPHRRAHRAWQQHRRAHRAWLHHRQPTETIAEPTELANHIAETTELGNYFAEHTEVGHDMESG